LTGRDGFRRQTIIARDQAVPTCHFIGTHTVTISFRTIFSTLTGLRFFSRGDCRRIFNISQWGAVHPTGGSATSATVAMCASNAGTLSCRLTSVLTFGHPRARPISTIRFKGMYRFQVRAVGAGGRGPVTTIRFKGK
jgi:hypothetical protein